MERTSERYLKDYYTHTLVPRPVSLLPHSLGMRLMHTLHLEARRYLPLAVQLHVDSLLPGCQEVLQDLWQQSLPHRLLHKMVTRGCTDVLVWGEPVRGMEEVWKSGGENGGLCCARSIFHLLDELQYISKCVPGFLQVKQPY